MTFISLVIYSGYNTVLISDSILLVEIANEFVSSVLELIDRSIERGIQTNRQTDRQTDR